MTIQINPRDLQAAPVLALHSSASNGRQWAQLAEDITPLFSLNAPNLPGYGNRFLRRDNNGVGLASIANPIVDQLKSSNEPVHIVGHSFGAAVALKVALLVPDMIKSITLYEPAAFHVLNMDTDNQKHQRSALEIQQLSGLISASVASGDDGRAMQLFIDYWNGEGSWRNLPGKVQANLLLQVSAVMSDFAASFTEKMTKLDLAGIEIPTLIMTGLNSPDPVQDVALALSRAITGARLAMLPELNHMAPILNPEWVNPRIRDHLVCCERPMPKCIWPQTIAA